MKSTGKIRAWGSVRAIQIQSSSWVNLYNEVASSILFLPLSNGLSIPQGSLILSPSKRADGSRGQQGGMRAGAPSVCVNLSSDHTHDFLLYLGVLSINVGIAHLTIFISAKDRASVSVRGTAVPEQWEPVQLYLEVCPFQPRSQSYSAALWD